MPSLKAGDLRRRVAIQEYVYLGQDPDTGAEIRAWQTIPGYENIHCAIVPLSVKEFIAAQAIQSKVSARIVLRYDHRVNASMRMVHSTSRGVVTIYNPEGFLPDPVRGNEYMTSPVSAGTNDG